MNWLTNFVRPKIRALVTKDSKDVPENLWQKCTACEQMIFHRELEANLRVCPHCGHHMRLDAKKRLAILFDEGEYTKIELPKTVVDPLRFRDRKPDLYIVLYENKLRLIIGAFQKNRF